MGRRGAYAHAASLASRASIWIVPGSPAPTSIADGRCLPEEPADDGHCHWPQRSGASVAIWARTEEQLDETASLIQAPGGQVEAFTADITDEQRI
jgi:hypothetical protein